MHGEKREMDLHLQMKYHNKILWESKVCSLIFEFILHQLYFSLASLVVYGKYCESVTQLWGYATSNLYIVLQLQIHI